MADYLVGPGGLKVTPVQLGTNVDLVLARMREPDAQPGEIWYRVTFNGMAVGLPGYYQMHELTELLDELGLTLADLHDPDAGVGSQTA